MYTMLYDADTLKPQLLIKEDIKNGDVGKSFWVINGFWNGVFNGDSITIQHPDFEDRIPSTVYKCYKFSSSPPEKYLKLAESMGELGNLKKYSAWFAHFEDLISKGEIK